MDKRGKIASLEEENSPLYFGDWLKRRREDLNLTQAELGQRTCCTVFTIRKIEAGERRPSRQLAGLLAQALDIPCEDQDTFIKAARGERSLGRLPSPARTASRDAQPAIQSSPVPGSLPRALTPFVGREPELSALGQLLQDPHCSLLTIVGPGGIGKTRLAIEAARRSQDLFPDGVWFVPLAGLNSTVLLGTAIASAINISFQNPNNPQKQLFQYLQNKKALLVLDNAEHLLEGAGVFSEIIKDCPQVKLLVTSRERLNLLSEWVFEITGLPVPPSHQVEPFESYSSIALFLQSARRSQAGFELREEDRRSVLKICQIVEGMPLGIELSAAWVSTLSMAEIAAEIENSLDFLSTSARDVPERQRSMRAVFDHSWQMLSPDEQQVLRQLSVFRGGFTRQAAEQVAGIKLDSLSGLLAKSLIQRDRQKRYSLHELVRQYAARQLETAGELEEVQRRHITFFINFAEKGREDIGGPLVATLIKWMELDIDNLRAALEYTISLHASHMALRLGDILRTFWEFRGLIDEGRRWLNILLDLPGDNTKEYMVQRGQALQAAGVLARIQGDFEAAHRFYREGLALCRQSGDMKGLALVLNSLGVLLMYEGKCAEAETYIQESLQLCRELDIKIEIVRRLNNLGMVATYQGAYEKARLLLEESLPIFRELNDRHGVAASLQNLGVVLCYQGKYERSMEVLEESLALFREIGDVQGLVIALDSFARVHLAKGNTSQALAAFHESLTQNQKVGNMTELASSLEGIAEALEVSARHSPLSGDRVQLAVRLLAAADRVRTTSGACRLPVECAEYERITAQLRSQCAEPNFSMEWIRGGEMTTEQSVEFALIYLSQISRA